MCILRILFYVKYRNKTLKNKDQNNKEYKPIYLASLLLKFKWLLNETNISISIRSLLILSWSIGLHIPELSIYKS